MNNKEAFARWFQQATGNEPYPFQIRFACESMLPELVDVPATAKTLGNYVNPIPYQKEKANV